MIRKHIIFYGRVQGVGFRFYAVEKARSLNLTGYVQNLPDGTVEMEVQGERWKIDELLSYLDNRRWIRIESMDMKSMEPVEEREFREKPTW